MLTYEGLKKLGHPDPNTQASIEYRVYRQLCMAKHANPLFQMQHGLQLHGDKVLAMNGPDTSEAATKAAWFALEHAAGFGYVALASLVNNHIDSEDREDCLKKVIAIGAARKELEAAAKGRWGTEDPFPGKWRV